ncbi:AraC family transcriptional regulator, partial [Rhizobium ruizarguesonis]
VAPLMNEVQQAHVVRRIELFMMIVGLLSRAQDSQLLASPSYLPDPSGYMSAGINKALSYIRENLTKSFDWSAIAERSASSKDFV